MLEEESNAEDIGNATRMFLIVKTAVALATCVASGETASIDPAETFS